MVCRFRCTRNPDPGAAMGICGGGPPYTGGGVTDGPDTGGTCMDDPGTCAPHRLQNLTSSVIATPHAGQTIAHLRSTGALTHAHHLVRTRCLTGSITRRNHSRLASRR